MMRWRLRIRTILVVALMGVAGCDEDGDQRISREEVKEAVIPRVEREPGVEGPAIPSGEVKVLDANDVAANPSFWEGELLRSTARLIGVDEGAVARFSADEQGRQAIALRIPEQLAGPLSDLAMKDPEAKTRPWVIVTYRVDEKVAEGAKTIGEMTDVTSGAAPTERETGAVDR